MSSGGCLSSNLANIAGSIFDFRGWLVRQIKVLRVGVILAALLHGRIAGASAVNSAAAIIPAGEPDVLAFGAVEMVKIQHLQGNRLVSAILTKSSQILDICLDFLVFRIKISRSACQTHRRS